MNLLKLITFVALMSTGGMCVARVQPILPAESAGAIIRRIGCSIDTILDKMPCSSIRINAPTTITASGSYCLSRNIAGVAQSVSNCPRPLYCTVTINASNVVLDLNNQVVSNTNNPGICIGAYENIIVKNGTVLVTGADAIRATGTQGLTIDSVLMKNATRGLYLDGVVGGTISNCNAINNETGIELNNANNLIITNCTASKNIIAGFSLISSSNNCIQQCKALGNGIASTSNGFGFVSLDGSTNIFSNCTADATQTTTTNFDSVAAGFALLGTEQCSTIVNSCASNAFGTFVSATIGTGTQTQQAIYSALPCGILLESISSKTLITTASISPGGSNDVIYSVNWSPDGKYLAAGGLINEGLANSLFVYQFNPASTTPLVAIASINPDGGSTGDTILSVNWSPDAKYLAVGGDIDTGNDVWVYQFNPTSSTPLVPVASINPGGGPQVDLIYSVNWSPNSKYLAIGGTISGSGNALWVYQFDPASSTRLTVVAAINPGGGSASDTVLSVNWSPDGKYLAIGGQIQVVVPNGDDIWIYQFDPGSSTPLSPVASINPDGGSTNESIYSVNWSSDGKYLAVGGQISGATGYGLWVYQFDPLSNTPLVAVASINPDSGSIFQTITSVNWSADGKYLAVGGEISGTTGYDLWVYQFDPSSSTPLLTTASINPDGGASTDFIFSVNWAPDGTYLAVGGFTTGATGNPLWVYQFNQNYPQKNFIQNNTVYCNATTSTVCSRGVGISGSSIKNCIIGNTAYNNPSNYAFVTIIHSQLLNGHTNPSSLQKVSLIGCQPISIPNELNKVFTTATTINTEISCLKTLLYQLINNHNNNSALVPAC